jgi:hypothetical protein
VRPEATSTRIIARRDNFMTSSMIGDRHGESSEISMRRYERGYLGTQGGEV